jgi:DNA-binding XRE family transcriptional regulator
MRADDEKIRDVAAAAPQAEPGGKTAAREAEATKKRAREAADSAPRPNNVRKIRIENMLSKAELARRANVSVLTIDRVEKGFGCRVDTKRKILEALGLTLADRVRVFGEEE